MLVDSHFEKNDMTTKSSVKPRNTNSTVFCISFWFIKVWSAVRAFFTCSSLDLSTTKITPCLFQEVLRQLFHFQFWTFQIPGDEFVDTILQHFGHLPTSMGDGCHISKVQILQHRAFACTNEAKDQDFVGTIPQMNQICSRFKTFKTTQQFTKNGPTWFGFETSVASSVFSNISDLLRLQSNVKCTHLTLNGVYHFPIDPKHKQVVTALVAEEPILDHFSRPNCQSPTALRKVEAPRRYKPEFH